VAMNRLKKGREEREKVKAMLSRGGPETPMQPLSIPANLNYKGVFSTFTH